MLKSKNEHGEVEKIRDEIQKNLERERKLNEDQKQQIIKLEDELDEVKMKNKLLEE